MKKKKKKTVKEKLPAKEEVIPVIEEPPPPKPVEGKEEGNKTFKIVGVIILLAIVATLVFYFLMPSETSQIVAMFFFFLPSDSFQAGTSVDTETFKGVFDSADRVYIVMDVRGIRDSVTRQNILQCGVDFAASSGMGGKNVTYYSIADEGCYTVDGTNSTSYCLSTLKDGITIYVKEGSPGAKYYSNGMIVTLGSKYTVGTCGIHKT